MSSEVEICNLGLAHLGDSATVSSIDPPEGSSQAEHCARWYPIARDSLLEMHDWGFATTRAVLAEVTTTFTEWQHAYAYPADTLKILAILASDAVDDYSVAYPLASTVYGSTCVNQRGVYTPQKFSTESDQAGNRIILTNQENAICRYTRKIIDTSKFSPLFRDTLGWYLSSYLAGPVLKGETGIAIGKSSLGVAMGMLAQAKLSDASQQRQDISQQVPWLVGR